MLPIIKSTDSLDRVLKRRSANLDTVEDTVREIISKVRLNGDSAALEYARRFDNYSGDLTPISDSVIQDAYNTITEKQRNAIKNAFNNVVEFHKRGLRSDCINTIDGVTTGYMMRPVERAGIYVPGGKAAYPSTVVMCAGAARAAGVEHIAMCTPNPTPFTLCAARICGVKEIYCLGGVQAIAAMAYGTESIPKVDVIVGPGNIYVTAAKRAVFGDVNIDLIAGPSEIVIVADESARADYICQDLLSQAEHDELAAAILITDSSTLAKKVQTLMESAVDNAKRKQIIKSSLDTNGTIILCKDLIECMTVANKIAPEHLELYVDKPDALLKLVKNAGCVFMGAYTPEPVGDYYAGTNHVLPTGGTARVFSGLSADNFLKKINVVEYDKNALNRAAEDIITLAEGEQLFAHAEAVKIRK